MVHGDMNPNDGSGEARDRGPEVGYDTKRPARSLYETAREVILGPREFFGRLSPEYERGPDHPVWFAVAVGVLTAPLFLVTEAVDPLARAQPSAGPLESLRGVAEGTGLSAAIALALFFWLLSPLFVGARSRARGLSAAAKGRAVRPEGRGGR